MSTIYQSIHSEKLDEFVASLTDPGAVYRRSCGCRDTSPLRVWRIRPKLSVNYASNFVNENIPSEITGFVCKMVMGAPTNIKLNFANFQNAFQREREGVLYLPASNSAYLTANGCKLSFMLIERIQDGFAFGKPIYNRRYYFQIYCQEEIDEKIKIPRQRRCYLRRYIRRLGQDDTSLFSLLPREIINLILSVTEFK